MTTRSQEAATDVAALLRARNPLLWIVTREEARVERHLFQAAAKAGYGPLTWDCGQGTCDGLTGREMPEFGGPDLGEVLSVIRARSQGQNQRNVWVMRDLTPWLAGPIGIVNVRRLRNLARTLPGTPRGCAQAIIVISPSGEVPAELAGHATVIDWPLPDREEIAEMLRTSVPEELADQMTDQLRDAAVDAAVGLSGEEAQNCFARSLVQIKGIDPALIAREKKRVIARERVLEWYDPLPGGLDAVGGLDLLKKWLVQRRTAYSAEARAYGLPAPKGMLLLGPPGTGKSLTAKAVATAWEEPLLKVDLGALRSKFVGESEANLRRALRTIEAVGRCVVWLDEIEKSLAGATDGAADGGVSQDVLGTILTWMQERRGEAFVIATANDVSKLPPELLRKGRFDEVWWVDLPNTLERVEVLKASLRQFGRAEAKIDCNEVSTKCDGYTGAEIAALVPDALFSAFADGEREVTTEDLVAAARDVTPLSKTMEKRITDLRNWAKGRARPATSDKAISDQRRSDRRELDI